MKNPPTLFRCPFRAMGSPCELQLYARDEAAARALAALAQEDVERLEQRYSRYRADSLLSRINRVAQAGGRIEVDAETAALLDYAEACHRQSDGLFDITSGLLRAAWRFDRAQLPAEDALAGLLARIGWQRLCWRRPVLEFSPGMELDFGGIVKEYAADRIATLLGGHGCASGFVNLGGDIRIVGPHPDGAPWRIAIQDPRGVRGDPLGCVELESGAMATSGDYERCMIVDGVRYGHVLNPLTGWPVRHLASVSVVADYCVIAGSASTIAMLRESAGVAWLEELGLPHRWIDVEGRQGGTPGLVS